ncbi:MAG: type II toxin-antitoxin system VapC family toxin [Terracidiphilus sp.]|jgi:PIN domain nuclease of toxin-antitoxin system
MTYLLDTHTLIWFLRSPQALPARVRGLIEDEATTLVVSLATPWEMSIKTSIGKLDAEDILADFESIVARARFNVLAPTIAQVIASGRLPWFHRDPFDRLLVAQTMELGWSLLSKDVVFDAYGVRRIWS